MVQTQKTRLKRRIHGYRTLGCNFVYMLESDFKGVFSPMMVKKDINDGNKGWGFVLDDLINICSEEECQELNSRLECYQLDKRFG